ncbi:UNVERIFIED_CONTAM: hypothetical protein FKN15_028830, partial [Acipenser sinensis]
VFLHLFRISLNTLTLNVKSDKVYTRHGVPISVTGIAQVKIQGQNKEMLAAACQMFMGKSEQEIAHIALETLEGHQRAIMAHMTVEEIYKDRKKFSEQVFKVASSDLVNMGISVVSYTLKDVHDDQDYLHSLGKARTAQVQKDARIGEAMAKRDAVMREAHAMQEKVSAQYVNEIEMAKAQRDFELKKAAYDVEVAKTKQRIEEERMQVQVVERAQQIMLQEQEITRKDRELDAKVKKPADAERYRLERLAEAESIINKYRETSSVIDKLRTGRPKKLSNKDEQYFKIISLRNIKKTSFELTTELAEGTDVIVHQINSTMVTLEIRT